MVTIAAVAREGSFSRAAAALSLSQPAVSQQISALEIEVGARLLDRRPEGLVLTEAGRALLEHAAVIAVEEGTVDELPGRLGPASCTWR